MQSDERNVKIKTILLFYRQSGGQFSILSTIGCQVFYFADREVKWMTWDNRSIFCPIAVRK